MHTMNQQTAGHTFDAPSAPMQAVPPAPADPIGPQRVRLTPTRVRQLDAAIVATISALERSLVHVDGLLVGRDEDQSPAVEAIRSLAVELADGNLVTAKAISTSLVNTFDAFGA